MERELDLLYAVLSGLVAGLDHYEIHEDDDIWVAEPLRLARELLARREAAGPDFPRRLDREEITAHLWAIVTSYAGRDGGRT